MSIIQIEKLSRENKQLKQKISQYEMKIRCLKNDSDSHEQLIQRQKSEKQNYEKQIKQLKRREEEKHYERQDMQSRYLNVLKKLEDELEDRKRKYQKLQSKIEPLVNHDTVRLKILNQVQSAHQLQMDQYKRNIDNLKDQILKLKRQNELLKYKNETDKMDAEQKIRKLNNKFNERVNGDHFNQTTYEICMEIQNRLRLNYEQSRKQSQYYKEKYFTNEKKYQQKLSNLEKQLYLVKQKVKIEGAV